MNIVKENLEAQVELLKVTVEEADYSQSVESALKNYKKKANIPGFRPGMVPMGVIKKMYHKGAVAEESYRVATSAVYKYITDNKIEMLGDPLPADSQPALDFENGSSFEFHFKIGVASDINVDLSKLSLKKYKIAINDELREGYKNSLLNRFGQLVDVETITKDEAVSVTLSQPDMKIEDAYVGLISMTDDERAPFIDKKVGDKMQVNVNDLYKSDSQRASILGVKEAELASINPEFDLEITRIRKFSLPTMDADFYAQAFPGGEVTNESQFNLYVDNQLTQDLAREAEFKFMIDTREDLVKAANVTLPENFLKEWLFAINEGKFTREDIEKEFPQFTSFMQWDILRKKYAVEGDLQVGKEEMTEEAKNMARAQFAQYGMVNIEDEMLNNYADRILSNKEEQRRIMDSIYDKKITDYVASKAIIVEQDVTVDEFKEAIGTK